MFLIAFSKTVKISFYNYKITLRNEFKAKKVKKISLNFPFNWVLDLHTICSV